MLKRGIFPVWPLALVVGLWPIVAVHAALLLSLAAAAIEPSYPLLDGRYSVSAVARQLPTLYWFRIAIMPYAVMLVAFWLVQGYWLQRVAGTSPRAARLISFVGVAGALFILLYASFLGTDGELYGWLRRFGATLLFALTALAQLCCLPALQQANRITRSVRWHARLATACSISLLLIGLASLPLPLLLDDPNAWQNRVEWWFGAMMMTWFVAVAGVWRGSGTGIALLSRPAPRQ